MCRSKPKKQSTQQLNKIETTVQNMLKAFKVSYEPNAQVDKYSVDFLVEGKYIIECYGDFWHCNPTKYSPSYYNRGKKKTASDIWKRDECRKNFFESLGYKFLHLWESEIKGNQKNVRKKIKRFIRLQEEE
jgi:very-short-patch-repair endonuclease